MKYILFIAFILSVVSCAKHDGYTLTGHVPEAWEGKPVFLVLDDTNQPHLLTARKYREVNSNSKVNSRFRVIARLTFTLIPMTDRPVVKL